VDIHANKTNGMMKYQNTMPILKKTEKGRMAAAKMMMPRRHFRKAITQET